ncbi:helix-turn-helix domain-containing protein [Streptoalloteichus hindustanus]|uniref:DNA-binding transcriptional regulator, MerR family n=1 Tax=Streptoalloteichus hindustanus TaxID=2017 RepID=A0A1M5EZP0_STRHI|nr:MerR family transcriptional regulator [Streptoalloteichus hindustanus]SHF84472.1 DNA-binding transcriptional regulator, MerR family [Streptoalloteichus hindustanus]
MTDSAVHIGAAAALYDLTPSTLRWWERQGVLDPPGRDGHRRLYRERDLRRIGLAYLCCVTGMMPLDRAAVVSSGRADLREWRNTIAGQITDLERRVEAMEAARRYLAHLLKCEDDDIAAQCPVLEGELVAHTPRGRVPESDLVAAARAAQARGGHTDAGRDENGAGDSRCDEKAGITRCPGCSGVVTRSARGRPRKYCSRACQQRAYRARRSTVPQAGKGSGGVVGPESDHPAR